MVARPLYTERIGAIIGDRKQFGDDYVIKSYLFKSEDLLNPRLKWEAIRRAPSNRMKIWSYVKGIVERNSLSGNWIASLDREVIKKFGYIGEAYV